MEGAAACGRYYDREAAIHNMRIASNGFDWNCARHLQDTGANTEGANGRDISFLGGDYEPYESGIPDCSGGLGSYEVHP